MSRLANFMASSTIQRMDDFPSPESSAFAAPRQRCSAPRNVGDFGPAGRGRERAAASIGKEINDLDRTRKTRLSASGLLRNPPPVLSLLGKQTDVAEIGSLQLEDKRTTGDRPACRRRGTRLRVAKGPLALLALAAIEAGIGREPELSARPGRQPQRPGKAGPAAAVRIVPAAAHRRNPGVDIARGRTCLGRGDSPIFVAAQRVPGYKNWDSPSSPACWPGQVKCPCPNCRSCGKLPLS